GHSPSSLDHQSSFVHHGVTADHSLEVNPFAPADNEPFINIFALDPSSEVSSSWEILIAKSNQSTQKSIKNRTISTQDQKPQRKARSGSKSSSNNLTVKFNLSRIQSSWTSFAQRSKPNPSKVKSDCESWPPTSLYDRFQPSDGLVLLSLNKPCLIIIEDWISDSEDEFETKALQIVPSFVQSSEQVKSPRHYVQHVETSIPAAPHKPASPKSASSGKRRNRKSCFVCKSLDHLIRDCDYHAKKMAQPTPRNHAHRGNHKKYALLTHTNPQTYMVPAAVLTQSKPLSITDVRPVSVDVPKIKVTRPRHANPIVTKSKSPIKRHITRSPSPMTNNSPPRVTAVKAPVELNGGYVAFGGNPKGGKIYGKGKIKTSKLDFDNVYFVKELKFNLFSVSQICDKKNSVLFTDTECLVLSPDFKPLDDSQVLLRVPRENSMYNVNLKNIVPYGDLTFLFAKAKIDESNLWHRRLAHINFKTINKLVKGNLVRGIPTNFFKNDHTCVACKKGKQHIVSCKTKPVSSVDQPLYRIHMDLFGLTFVKSLNKKSYCLVTTDDYSRFTWVFFLATKDATSPIRKTFSTGLENQLSLKGIKREFSVPRTHQQYCIAKRKNRTLIEAARTMLVDSLLPIPFWAKAINTACYVQNRVLVTKPHNKTPYELLHGRTPRIGFMRPFGCPVTILNTLDCLGKFERKVDEGFLVEYSVSRNQTNPSAGFQDKFDAEKAGEEIDQQYVLSLVWSPGSKNPQNNNGDAVFDGKDHDFNAKKPESEVSVSPSSSAQSRKQDDKTKKEAKGKNPVESFTGYRDLSTEFKDCSNNNIIELNAASIIVPIVGQNSLNSTNTFSAAGPLNAAASPTYGKSLFIDASQLPDDLDMPELEDITYSDDEDDVGFEDPDHPKKVYKVAKALYGLPQAPRDWKFRLTEEKSASTPIDTEKPLLKDPDGEDVDVHTYRSMIGSLMYITSSRPGIMFAVCACARFQMTPKASHLHVVKRIISYLKGKPHLGLWYPKNSPFDLVAYSDSDYASASLDRKSITRECQFFGCRLISWQCKKQTVVSTSSTEAEYVAASSYSAQVLWIQNQLLDYGDSPLLGVNTPRSDEDRLELMELTVFLLPKVEKVRIGVNVVDLQVSAVRHMLLLKKVIVTKATIREALRLDDVEGVDCLSNEEIFPELARMGYEKPSTKLTFYKAFFLEPVEVPYPHHLTVHDLVRNVNSTTKFHMYPRFLQLIIRKQVGDISTHTTKYTSPALTQKEIDKEGDAAEHVKEVNIGDVAEGDDCAAHGEVPTIAKEQSIPSPTPPTPPPQPPQDIPLTSQDDAVVLKDDKDVADAVKDVEKAKVDESAQDQGRVAATPSRRRKGVIIRDPKEESTTSTIIPAETKSKDKAIDHVKLKAKEDPAVKRYQAIKRKPQTEAQARKNMMMYLKNVAGFKLDYFKGISYDDIQRAAKRRKLDEEVEDLKIHLQIVPNEDDDVYTEATLLARNVPVVDYEIIEMNNKPYYKIIRDDGTHQLYISFLTLLRNFDREDLEALWSLVKQRFSTAKPKNFFDDFLLTTLGAIIFHSLFGFDHHLKTLEANFSKFVQTNQFARAVSSIPGIVERYMDQRMNEAANVVVQIQSDRFRDEAQAKNEEFFIKLDENIQKIIKEQVKEQVKVQVSKILPKIKKTMNEQLEDEVLSRSSNSFKTSYAVAADLSELELNKILIEKIESNKSIHRSDEQRNLYKSLVDAYECDKIILDTYGDTVTLKRRRDDVVKDEEPFAGSDWGSKRRRERKEPESTSALKEKATKTTGKSTQGSKSHQNTASESTSAEEPRQTTQDLEEPSHQELETDTLTRELLAGQTYELMKGSCKSLVELEFFLEEVYKATTDQLDWNNPEGQQYPHNVLNPLPLIPNSRGYRVIPFDHFINNDLEYLRGCAYSRKYTTSVTKIKTADYRHIKWIEDLVPSTMWSQELNKDKQNRLMRIDELHKFSDGMLNDDRTALDDRLKGIRMKYLPQAIWRRSDKERAAAMIQAIDK
nr:hypothetical protein [Tanacetum cinerariifolium]